MKIPSLMPEHELLQRFGIGRYGAGNIDLYSRPQYINPDGAVSTVRSLSFSDDEGEILVPTVAFDKKGLPYLMSDDEARDRYYKTGEFLGKFKTAQEANDYAERLHQQQGALYGPGWGFHEYN